MPRTFTRTTIPLDENKLKKAVEAVQKGANLYAAATKYGVPRTTLRRRMRASPQKHSHQVGFDACFSIDRTNGDVCFREQETALKNYLLKSVAMYYGLTYKGIRTLAYQFGVTEDSGYAREFRIG